MLDSISIDIVAMVVSAALLCFALVTPWMNGFFRKPKDLSCQDTTEETTLPPLSIILTPHENARELERNLPLLLRQDYPAGFELIVVVLQGDNETEDMLKRFAGHSQIYTTYIPSTSRYMSRKKLAITLGMKAAKNEWVVLTDIECRPTSDRWLHTMAQQCGDHCDMVIGYTAYDEATSSYRRFERLHTDMYLMREDCKGTPYRHNGCNLLLRKSMFIRGDGFRGNLNYLRGEYDFIVNKYATDSNTVLALHPDSWLTEQEPTDKAWQNKHLFYMETRQHLRRSFRHRWLYNTDQWAQHLNYLLIVAAITYSIPTQQWLITATAAVSLLLTIILRTVIARKALLLFNEHVSTWKIIPFEISILWHHASYMLRHHRANKYNFISHKI